MSIDFDCLYNRLDSQLTCKSDSLLVDSFDETAAEKTDSDKHYSYNEIEKTEKIDAEIETIVAEIATNDCYCYTDRIVENEHLV